MIKLTILYREPADKEAFERFYTANLALMEQIPHVLRREVSHVFGAPDGNPAYYRALELYFADRQTLDAAMRSEAGALAGQHLMGHASQLAEVFFCEVYEEAGGSTPGALPHAADSGAPQGEG
ncbi:MAG: hypothetical protein Kow0077_08460 [Anaerolineae bacterium]